MNQYWVGQSLSIQGVGGLVSAITHNRMVIWIKFPHSISSEPYTTYELAQAK